jgi:AcrR family transcriptional regulator
MSTRTAKHPVKSQRRGQARQNKGGGASRPGPKPALSIEQIAKAAIELADREGLRELSMERVAREVVVTTMALYRYFANKEQLLDAMIEHAGGPVPALHGAAREWRSRLAEWTRGCAAIYRDHPWFLQAAVARRRVMGPNELGWLDAALSVLGDTGLPFPDQWRTFLVLIGHVRSHAEFSAADKQGLSLEQWAAATARMIANEPARYPALASALDSGAFAGGPSDAPDFGLECILEGIESLVRKRRK